MPVDASRTKPKILVLHNENPDWTQEDRDAYKDMMDLMWSGLREQGYVYAPASFFDNLSVLDGYDPAEWLVWNWAEELAGKPWTDALIVDELERRGFTYTGSTASTLRLSQNRMTVKECLRDAGLPTLAARVFTSPDQASEWSDFPAIVKGLNQHASYGIGRDSVVETTQALAARIAWMRETFADDSLVEPFLDTREFHVAVWGNDPPEALPPLEFDYSAFDDMHDRLYTYEAKFDMNSRGFKEIKMPCPAPADRPDWRQRLERIARDTYRLFDMRDYGRVDLRMLGDEPQVLDVNANPDLDPLSVLPTAARALGMDFGAMVDRIITFASARMPSLNGAATPASRRRSRS
jgi:D-alanine-D-alanine ligase